MGCLNAIVLIVLLPVVLVVATPVLLVVSLFGREDYCTNLWANYRRLTAFWTRLIKLS